MGDKDPSWWNYLSEKATDAVSSDEPDEQQYDTNGKVMAGISPKFLTWAKIHSLTPEQAEHRSYLEDAAVLFLEDAGDQRAIPILRQGLLSQHSMIQIASAIGLANLQDSASIPLIIDACEHAPADLAFGIARALVDFNTPEAQSAA